MFDGITCFVNVDRIKCLFLQVGMAAHRTLRQEQGQVCLQGNCVEGGEAGNVNWSLMRSTTSEAEQDLPSPKSSLLILFTKALVLKIWLLNISLPSSFCHTNVGMHTVQVKTRALIPLDSVSTRTMQVIALGSVRVWLGTRAVIRDETTCLQQN